jgi:hypothetical protein
MGLNFLKDTQKLWLAQCHASISKWLIFLVKNYTQYFTIVILPGF